MCIQLHDWTQGQSEASADTKNSYSFVLDGHVDIHNSPLPDVLSLGASVCMRGCACKECLSLPGRTIESSRPPESVTGDPTFILDVDHPA